jgi:hypothetical protein
MHKSYHFAENSDPCAQFLAHSPLSKQQQPTHHCHFSVIGDLGGLISPQDMLPDELIGLSLRSTKGAPTRARKA